MRSGKQQPQGLKTAAALFLHVDRPLWHTKLYMQSHFEVHTSRLVFGERSQNPNPGNPHLLPVG